MNRVHRGMRRLWRLVRSPAEPDGNELVSLDLETSSLDPRTASILAIAAVPVRGRRILVSERFERQVRGEASVDREAVKFHRPRPVDVAQGVTAPEAAEEFLAWLDGRPVIGYCTSFDCAMLERALHGVHGRSEDPDCFDLRDLYRRSVLRRNPDGVVPQAFDEILSSIGVPAMGRHTALGDAIAVAMAWLMLAAGRR